MSNPKRKVTDLLPTEAILISSDAERDAVLKLMDEAWMKWNSGERANYAFIRNQFPYALAYKFNGNDGFPNRGIRIVDFDYDGDVTFYPATDFIPTESDEVEEGSTIESVFKLAKWILENRVSSIIDADIPQEDKDRIARHFGYSADLTNP